jgi:hypothetical protein
MTQRIIFLVSALPPVMRMGVLILAAGGTLDVLYHAAPAGWAIGLDNYLGAQGTGAHVVTLLGMVVTLLGLPVRRAPVRAALVADIASERRASSEE